MTALVGRDGKQTFSEIRSFSAGLPGRKTLKASGQYGGDFLEPIAGPTSRHNQKLTRIDRMSRDFQRRAKTKAGQRTWKGSGVAVSRVEACSIQRLSEQKRRAGKRISAQNGSPTQMLGVPQMPLQVPLEPDSLAGLTLSQAFQKCVLDDPEVIACGLAVPEDASVFIEGQYPGSMTSYLWPTRLEPAELASAFVYFARSSGCPYQYRVGALTRRPILLDRVTASRVDFKLPYQLVV